ncbi:hypothetical protein L873DRAFT_1836242 [Choiromyces venosus 120613-1]|uniref:Uncharacterized protein n=1 Tax=Choiromyces venosus 120613-1 TaxID=1336337 RepID=A0A3N4JI11_9PEZI|nr:hypothetical protein L873DRAFT_1836242 [Choiromyces venosus 120613-1]
MKPHTCSRGVVIVSRSPSNTPFLSLPKKKKKGQGGRCSATREVKGSRKKTKQRNCTKSPSQQKKKPHLHCSAGDIINGWQGHCYQHWVGVFLTSFFLLTYLSFFCLLHTLSSF